MSEREKTYVEDVNRSIYDIRNEEKRRLSHSERTDARHRGRDLCEKEGSRMDGEFPSAVIADL